jgi:hypothetical protein
VASRADREDERKVPREDGEKMASDLGAVYFEVACAERDQVVNCFLKTVECFFSRNNYLS